MRQERLGRLGLFASLALVVARDDSQVGMQGPSLVGREPELTALTELDADAGRGRLALIAGEAVIGKTSLTEAVEAMARESRFDVAWGRGSSAEMPSYWWPLRSCTT